MAVTLTNKLNLPDQVVKACLYDTHKVAGDYSVSQIIDSARVRLLKRANDYEEDVSNRLYALMGTVLHSILERSNMSSVEKRAFSTVIGVMEEKMKGVTDEQKKEGMAKAISYLNKFMAALYPEQEDRYLYEVTQRVQIGEKVLYGTPDLFDKATGILYDYKYCSVFMFTNPESQRKWEAQTNVYAWLLTQAGYEVKEIRIVAFFRDWSSQPFNKKKDYPDSQIKELILKVRSPAQMTEYVTKRMTAHQQAEETGILPLCTGRERWATADQWAVKTPSAAKALRVGPEEVCDKFIIDQGHRYEAMYKEFRPGQSTKCEKFCPVKDFCDQYRDEKALRLKQSNDE
jgi:hypothetical protein